MARCSRSACRRWRPDAAIRVFGLGLSVDDNWFCSNRCVEADAVRRLRDLEARADGLTAPAQKLGAILLQQRKITASQLTAALDAQRASGLRLGTQLQKLGYLTRDGLLGALSAQHGVKYLAAIDHQSVRTGPGGLSIDEVRALGLVPFAESGGVLLVACVAPVPQAAVDALTTLSARAVQPFLVDDEEMGRLMREYASAAATSVPTTRVTDIPDGAAKIAAAAAANGHVTIKEARVDPYTWVRIAANGRVSTLLVEPNGREIEEHDTWQAATTQH